MVYGEKLGAYLFSRSLTEEKQKEFTMKRVLAPQEIEPWRIWGEITSAGQAISMTDFGSELTTIRGQVGDLASLVISIEKQLSACSKAIQEIRDDLSTRPVTKYTELFDINSDLEVIQPIPIVIEETNGEVVASFPDVELFAIGETEAEAIQNLKIEMRNLYLDLCESRDTLGELPLGWLRTLNKVVKSRGNP